MRKEIKNLKELESFAREVLKGILDSPQKESATVVGLSGDLGAGKTAFTKCVAHTLGISEVITSPTFILEKVYDIPPQKGGYSRFKKLVHIDAYRLSAKHEMRVLGWDALLCDPSNIIFLEWPEQVEGALPHDAIKISFTYINEGTRLVEIL